MWVHVFERTELAVQELTDHFAEPGTVLRKSGGVDATPASLEGFCQQVELSALAAAVDALDGDHMAQGLLVFRRFQTYLVVWYVTRAPIESQCNRRRSASQRCAC